MTEIVKLAGREVAIGLNWVNELGDEEKATAKGILANKQGLTQAVVFSDASGMTYVGYDESSSKWKSVPSAAAWMAAAQDEDAQGVLVQRVSQDSFWVVAVGHNQLLFGTDLVLSARSAAEHVEGLILQVPELAIMVGPDCEDVLDSASWEASQTGTFDGFFSDAKPPRAAYPRQIVGVSRTMGLAIIVGAVVVMLVLAGLGVREYQRRAAEEEARAAAAAQEALEASQMEQERERRIVAAVKAALRADTKAVDPQMFLANCQSFVDRFGRQTIVGWQLTRVQCNGERKRVELTFDLPGISQGGVGDAGSLAMLKEQLKIEGFKASGAIGGKGYDGTLSVQLELPDRVGIDSKDNLPTLERILNGWFSSAQRAFQGLNGTLSWAAPKPRAVQYKDPEAEKTVSARRDPRRAMQPVPPEKSYSVGTIRFVAAEVYVVASILEALEARSWLTLTSAKFDIRAEGDVQVTVDTKYLVQ